MGLITRQIVTEPRENFILRKPCKIRGQEVEVRNHLIKNGARPAKPIRAERFNNLLSGKKGPDVKQKQIMALIQCSKCGQMISDKAANCLKCGAAVESSAQQQVAAQPPINAKPEPSGVTPPRISTYVIQPLVPPQKPASVLAWAVLATVLCFLPAGIVEIVYSNKVDLLWYTKNYAEAQEAADNARTWCYVALVLGIISGIISGIYMANYYRWI
jgi:hypothetical protein